MFTGYVAYGLMIRLCGWEGLGAMLSTEWVYELPSYLAQTGQLAPSPARLFFLDSFCYAPQVPYKATGFALPVEPSALP